MHVRACLCHRGTSDRQEANLIPFGPFRCSCMLVTFAGFASRDCCHCDKLYAHAASIAAALWIWQQRYCVCSHAGTTLIVAYLLSPSLETCQALQATSGLTTSTRGDDFCQQSISAHSAQLILRCQAQITNSVLRRESTGSGLRRSQLLRPSFELFVDETCILE